jgi:hypothetical protein
MYSLARTFDRIAPSVPAQLVSPAAFARARAVAAHLPAGLTNWLYLECRLAAGDSRVDLALRVDERGREILAQLNPAISLGEPILSHPGWQGVLAFGGAWAAPRSRLYDGVERVWLEFDIEPAEPGTGDAVPAPGVFLEFAPRVYREGAVAEHHQLALASLVLLSGRNVTDPVARNLRRCLEQLPPGASLLYVGLLLSRGSTTARGCVTGLSDAQLPAYLEAIGWPGSPDDLARLLAPFSRALGGSERSVGILNFDVGETIHPGLGLELVLSRPPQVRGEIAEKELLDLLVRRALCSPAKRDALLAWPGARRETLPHELWPSLLIRRVNHVKLSYEPGAPLTVKGYLCFYHEFDWLRRGGGAHVTPAVSAATG